VRNRQRWRVTQVHDDGRLEARGRGGLVTLDADYCRKHVELANVTTVHSAQGLTRDFAGTIIDDLSGWRSVYVGMSRGRSRNTAYVALAGDDTAATVMSRALRRDRADLGASASKPARNRRARNHGAPPQRTRARVRPATSQTRRHHRGKTPRDPLRTRADRAANPTPSEHPQLSRPNQPGPDSARRAKANLAGRMTQSSLGSSSRRLRPERGLVVSAANALVVSAADVL
jgi:hypothetical protein